MKNKLLIFFEIIFLFLLFNACRKNIGNADWDTDIITPLIKTELTINNLLVDSLLHSNADSSLVLVYNNTLYNLSIDSLVSFPDSITHQYFHLPLTITANPGQQVLNITDNKNLNLGDAQLTRAIIKSGKIVLKIRNTIQEKMLCTYKIPCADINGILLEVTELIPAASINAPYEFTKIIDISGYNINLKGPNNTSYNKLTSVTQAWVDPNGNQVTVTNNDSLLFDAQFKDVIIDYAKGYFGSNSVASGIKYSEFSLFNKIISGQINLESIKLKLHISNGFGVDARFVFNSIKSINTRTNTTVSLASSLIGSYININRANETYNVANPVIPSVFEYNLSNSNIKQLIENLPDKIEYSLDIATNPLGNISSGNDFVFNSAGFKANLDMEIPLSLIATNLTLADTLNFNLNPQQGYQINNGKLTLIADNGFPFSSQLQIYLVDANNTISDSLLGTENIIFPAYINSLNQVTQIKQTKLSVLITSEKLIKMYDAKKVIILSRFNTTNAYTRIYNNYSLKLKLSGDFNMTLNNE